MTEVAVSSLSSMIMLSAQNFAIWKPRMEDLLYTKDLMDPIDFKGVKPEATSAENWRKLNRKAVGLIRQYVGLEVFHHICEETDAYTLWTTLQENYQSKLSRNKALLMRRLVGLKLRSGISVAVHVSGFQSMVNDLASVKLKFDDELQALLLISSLPDDWETVVVSLSNSAPDGKLTMSMVTDAMFSEEARRKEMSIHSHDGGQAFITEGRGRTQERAGGSNHGRSGSPGRKFVVTCYRCGQEGHIRRNCPKGKGDKAGGDDYTAGIVYDSDALLVTTAGTEIGRKDWVLDSGCSAHMCADRKSFTEYQACDEGSARMANGTASKIVGKGAVQFRMSDGRRVKLTDVRHVPGLRKNVISLGVLESKGSSFSASGGVLNVRKENGPSLQGKKIGHLYRLDGSVWTDGATDKHGSNGKGRQRSKREARRSHRRSRNWRRKNRWAQNDSPVLECERGLRDVYWKAQEGIETRSCLKKCTGMATTETTRKRVSFAPGLISDGYTSERLRARVGEVESRAEEASPCVASVEGVRASVEGVRALHCGGADSLT